MPMFSVPISSCCYLYHVFSFSRRNFPQLTIQTKMADCKLTCSKGAILYYLFIDLRKEVGELTKRCFAIISSQ